MTDSEKIGFVRGMAPIGTSVLEDDVVGMYLDAAKTAILNRLYPFQDVTWMDVPARYEMTQIRIAVYAINKRGAEGETRHIEVGTQRDFASADIPDDLLNEVVPMCGAPM